MSYMGKDEIIKNFLKQVENKLPGWLKDDKKELNDVLSELEEHILDKAKENAIGNEPTAQDLQRAVDSMGSPNAIAREYKKRGTPKVFISEEFWPWYIKALKIVAIVVISLNMIGFGISLISTAPLEAISDLFAGLWGGLFYGTAVITVIFVIFSMEGFLPEDFREIAEKERSKEEQKKASRTSIQSKKFSPPLKRGELLSDGIVGTIIGIFMITMPIESINVYLGPVFVEWLNIAGIFTMFGGFVSLIQALIGIQMITGQRILIAVGKLIDVLFLPRGLLIGDVLATIPSIASLEAGVLDIVLTVFHYIPYIVIFGFVVGMIEATVRIITLRSKYEKYEKLLNNQ